MTNAIEIRESTVLATTRSSRGINFTVEVGQSSA